MKARPLPLLLTLLLAAIISALPVGAVQAAGTTLTRKPLNYKTLAGTDGGQPVNALKVRDQSGTADNPSKYVSFTTPGKAYRGTQDFSLGSTYKASDVTGISLRVNYKGPAKSAQAWVWKLYDWKAKRWVKVGDNAAAQAGVWKLLIFSAGTSPGRFVNAYGKIRVHVSSGNASGNAKVDFEALQITVEPSPACAVQENGDFEAEVIALFNAERAKVGAAPLAANARLAVSSQRHSNDMACNSFFDHTGSDGSAPWDRMTQAGYTWIMAAENIAAGYSTPASVVAGWMASNQGHREAILNPDYEDVGIGYAYKSGSPWGHYWTADFGAQP
ncbi:MAG: CAP domain-containing protein [Chloroflexota bacterium]